MNKESRIFVRVAVFAAAVFLGSPARGGDYAQWRGPDRDGHSPETGLMRQWPKDGPKEIWRVKNLGGGFGSVAVASGHVFLLSNEGLENESVKAFSAQNGKPLWVTRIGKVGEPNQRPNYPGARSTPAVDGDWVYALGSDGDLACLAKDTGKIRWRKNVQTEFGGKPGQWAYAESPLVDGEAVVCTPGGDSATMLALNKNSGDVIWKAAIPGGDAAGYASIVISTAGGLKQYVQFLAKGVVGIEAKSGKFLWRWDRPAQGSPANIPTPVVFEDFVYASSGRGGGGLARLQVQDGTFKVEPVWFQQKTPTAIGGAVKVGEELYGTTAKSMLCLDFKSGQLKWEDKGIEAASICVAQGQLYLHGENGQVALVEATPEGYREKGRFTPEDAPQQRQGSAWAYPALADGRLYIRDMGILYCYDVRIGAVALK